MGIKISYGITVCNEFVEIQKLLPYLLTNKRPQDEIVILYDSKNGDEAVDEYLRSQSIANPTDFLWVSREFNNNFGDWKNQLNNLCTGDYIFQIDADEIPNVFLMNHLHEVIELNPEIDILLVPRENYVDGLTPEHIQKWGWKVDDNKRVNWPDLQWRVYKNEPEIKWVNKVHERLEGFKVYTHLPLMSEWSLNHTKDIKRQEKQNNFYDNL